MLHIIKNLYFLLIGIIGISFLISFHEFGHFIFARLFGIKAPSFSIGFGPKLISKKIGGTEFSLSAIPLGGYVEIAGNEEIGQGGQKDAKSKGNDSFNVKPYWQQLLVMFGGIMFNFFFAYFIIIGLFATGMPETPFLYPEKVKTIVQAVAPGSLAEKNNIQDGDTIISVNNKGVNTFKEYIDAVQKTNNEEVTFKIKESNGNIRSVVGKVPLGIVGFHVRNLPKQGIIESIQNGFHATNGMITNLFHGLSHIFKKRKFDGLGGPIAIFSQTFKTAQQGVKPFLIFLVLFSIQLALLNLLPLPILDGGQIVFITIEAIAGRELPNNIRMGIQYACWIFMILLTIAITFQDIKKLLF
jgi:regulator of sigma E protease